LRILYRDSTAFVKRLEEKKKEAGFLLALFAERRMAIFVKNCVCGKNLILLQIFRVLQHF
jgi:hypothetical protein